MKQRQKTFFTLLLLSAFSVFSEGNVQNLTNIDNPALEKLKGYGQFGRCERFLNREISLATAASDKNRGAKKWSDIIARTRASFEKISLPNPPPPTWRLKKNVEVYKLSGKAFAISDARNNITAPELKEYLNEFRADIVRCEFLIGTISGYNKEHYRDNDYRGENSKESFDRAIKCTNKGNGTLDFPGCYQAVNTYDAAFVAKTGLQQFQQVKMLDNSLDSQRKASQNPNDATIGLKLQKDSIKDQSGAANQVALADAIIASSIATIISNGLPDSNELIEDCKAFGSNETREKILKGFEKLQTSPSPFKDQDFFKDSDVEIEKDCSSFVHSNSQIFLQNQEALGRLKSVATQSGINAFANFAKAQILDNQADKIQNAIEKVDAFKPQDLSFAQEDEQATQCEVNPNFEGCAEFFANREVGFRNNSVSLTGFGNVEYGGASESGKVALGATGPENEGGEDITDGSERVGTFGSAIEGKNRQGGIAGNVPGAVGVKKGVSATRGGGGGGGAAGGGGGASSGAGQSANGKDAQSSFARNKNIAYSGKSRGLKFSGGKSRYKRKKKENSRNPFDNLFGKKGNNKKVSDLNFASGKRKVGNRGGDIFSMIDARYNVVESRGDLLKYELGGSKRAPASTP